METYPSEIEEGMPRLYHSLNEKNRRRFAGREALHHLWLVRNKSHN